ncbi:hypothetical protein Chor_016257 [Crotalus horridus]
MISGQSSMITVSPGKSCITKTFSVSTEKMGRLPLGSVSPYVKTSSGGSMDPMKFYCTSYGAAYGQEGFRPRNGFHFGAGYKSNYRPVVQYNPNLDKLDNPAVGLQKASFSAVIAQSLLIWQAIGYKINDLSQEDIVKVDNMKPEGFRKLLQDNYESTTNKHFQPLQLPDGKYPLPWSLHQPGSGYVREKPLTFPTTKTGPQFMSTEYGSKYHFNIPGQPDFLQKKTIGAKEESGFTEGCLANPIVEKLTSQDSNPGISIMKADYLPSSVPHGPPPNAEASGPLSHSQFQGHQRQPQTQTNLLGREYMGNKEPTGFSTNNLNYVTPAYDPNLPNRFYETISKGVDREGWTRGGIQPQQAGGFATNNHGTDLGSDPNATETLRTVHPHVGSLCSEVKSTVMSLDFKEPLHVLRKEHH